MLQGGSLEKEAVAGVAAGAASRIVVAPFDVLKIRFQLQHAPVGPAPLIRSLSPLANDVHTGRTYTSISQAVSRIVKEEGIVGMWRGNVAAMLLWSVYAGVQFPVYSYVQKEWSTALPGHVERGMAAGAIASAFATVASHPFDVLRTVMAAQGTPKVYHSNWHAVNCLGLAGLYRGLAPALVQVVPYMALTFGLYEGLGSILDDSPTSTFLRGVLSGSLSKLAVYPLDTVKRRLQFHGIQRHARYGELPQHTRMLESCKAILKTEGFLTGFYKGVVPSMAKSAVSTALTLSLYSMALRALDSL